MADASGARRFEQAHTKLSEIGVHVPRLYLLDTSHTRLASDLVGSAKENPPAIGDEPA